MNASSRYHFCLCPKVKKKPKSFIKFASFWLLHVIKKGKKILYAYRIPLFNVVVCFGTQLHLFSEGTFPSLVYYHTECGTVSRELQRPDELVQLVVITCAFCFCLQVQNHCKKVGRSLVLCCFCSYHLMNKRSEVK